MIKELTPADMSPVTLNATGNYNPRYGKQHIYVSGKGGTGTYTPGNPYDNSYTNAGYTNAGYYQPALTGVVVGYMVTTFSPSPSYGTTAGIPGSWYQYSNAAYATTTYNNLYPGVYWSPPSTVYWPATYTGPYPGPIAPSPFIWAQSGTSAGVGNVPASYTPGNYVAGNYVAGTSGINADTANVGAPTNVFGVAIPGGYGGAATAIPTTLGTSVPSYSTTPISITVPSGGYVTITFTL